MCFLCVCLFLAATSTVGANPRIHNQSISLEKKRSASWKKILIPPRSVARKPKNLCISDFKEINFIDRIIEAYMYKKGLLDKIGIAHGNRIPTMLANEYPTFKATVLISCGWENMNTFSHVPPGFRFHPTDEELVDYYLRRKVTSRRIDLDVIKDVDLYKIEPWDLQELCRIGTDEQNEWYFFSHKDKKYPTGTRTNRATTAGFWKATGRDKAIYSKHDLIGMRKTLVFYKGRAPNGLKSDWIMHEYRLETDENGTPQEEGWVVCRVFKKRLPTMRRMGEHDSPIWYDDQLSFMPDLDSPKQNPNPNYPPNYHHPNQNHSYPCKKELDFPFQNIPHQGQFFQLPLLDTPRLLQTSPMAAFGQQEQIQQPHNQNLNYYSDQAVDQVTDWRVLDKFVASQLSQDEVVVPKENNYANNSENCILQPSYDDHQLINKQDQMGTENAASTSTSSCQMDLWK